MAFGVQERKVHSGGVRVEFRVKGFFSGGTGSLNEMGSFSSSLTFIAVDFLSGDQAEGVDYT